MVPERLNDWSYEAINTLCALSESDRHDFKFNLADSKNMTKVCCAFANTFGGFIVIGVRDVEVRRFEIVGLDPDKELYGKFLAKVKADPDISISQPKTIPIPHSNKLLYAFEVPQSTRRPHLPSPADQRIFWKRQGSDCLQMTLEEIRYQMNSYEEKREKLALLLIDLHNKLQSVGEQSAVADGHYNGDVFSFEIIDRVVADAYAILKADLNIGSSWNRVGNFWGLMLEKAVHCLGLLHYGWAWNLASKMDGASSEAKPTALGYVFVPWFSTGTNSARDFR